MRVGWGFFDATGGVRADFFIRLRFQEKGMEVKQRDLTDKTLRMSTMHADLR